MNLLFLFKILHLPWCFNFLPHSLWRQDHRATIVIWLSVFFLSLTLASRACALRVFDLKKGQTAYGTLKSTKIGHGCTLLDIARNHDLGYNQIVAANPGMDPWVPREGATVLLPTMFVLPRKRLPSGIVVNLAEMRLYYFNKGRFWTCPVGVGKEGYSTKLSIYTVLSKVKNPVWVVPPSVRKEETDLPPYVLPGPDNPLGKYILRFSRLSYGIHGTNRPWGVGRRVSHGCIRLYSEDIASLFPLVPVGTLIRITYEPIKIGWAGTRCWLQVYRDYGNRIGDPLAEALSGISACQQAIGPLKIDFKAVKKALKKQTGVPLPVACLDKK
ncbi:MAG: L,D-transpeptidase family protein [Nitrospiraceae bacterium]|nr:L,D-transpeptidase family protein [Nitrospiraceae bacterium]